MAHSAETIYLSTLKLLNDAKLINETNCEELTLFVGVTLPPANLHYIRQLSSALEKLGEFGWANQSILSSLKNSASLGEGPSDDWEGVEDLGKSHPVFYAVRQIANLRDQGWAVHQIRSCLHQFVDLVYRRTAAPHWCSNKSDYYNDIYSARDMIIIQSSKRYSPQLKVYKQTYKNYDSKCERYNEVLTRRAIGMRTCAIDFDRLWANPPAFRLEGEAASEERAAPETDLFKVENPLNLLDKADQRVATNAAKREFAKENVRSLADRNQLSLTTLIGFQSELVSRGDWALLIASLIAATTGLNQERLSSTCLKAPGATESRLVIDAENHKLSYHVRNGKLKDGGAKYFLETVELRLPEKMSELIVDNIDQFPRLHNTNYPARAFARKNPGPSPTINRIARSAYTLLIREHLEELPAAALSGSIPVHRRASAAYVSLSNSEIETQFHHILRKLLIRLSFELKHRHVDCKNLSIILSQLDRLSRSATCNASGDNTIGSMIGSQPSFNFVKAFKDQTVDVFNGGDLSALIQQHNTLELRFFFDAQLLSAARAVGDQTEVFIKEGYLFSREKASRHYEEVKVLPIPTSLVESYGTLLSQRHTLLRRLIMSLRVKPQVDLERAYAIYWQIKRGETLLITKMSSALAHQLAIERIGYRPPLDRNNAARHQCATFTFENHAQSQVDVMLGHHVDGHAPNSRYSSSAAFDKEITVKCLLNNARRFGYTITGEEDNHENL
jgi:hypothetical protein